VSLGASLALYAMPEFWLGIMLLIAFGVGVGSFPGLFPTGGLSSPNTQLASLGGFWDVARHLFLPCLTLTLAYIAEYALVMRSSLLDELGEDYLTTARAKGLREALVLRRHAVPNALLAHHHADLPSTSASSSRGPSPSRRSSPGPASACSATRPCGPLTTRSCKECSCSSARP
jgi:ABC-type microcin C transport system permease subunit YejB